VIDMIYSFNKPVGDWFARC